MSNNLKFLFFNFFIFTNVLLAGEEFYIETKDLLIIQADLENIQKFEELFSEVNNHEWAKFYFEHIEIKDYLKDFKKRIELLFQIPNRFQNPYYSIRQKGSSDIIGHVSLVKSWGGYYLNYMIFPKFQRNGYAIQATRALLEYFFSELDIKFIKLNINDDNISSKKVAQRLNAEEASKYGETHF